MFSILQVIRKHADQAEIFKSAADRRITVRLLTKKAASVCTENTQASGFIYLLTAADKDQDSYFKMFQIYDE